MANTKMTIINGVLGLYSSPAVNQNINESSDAILISNALDNYLLGFFISCTLPWSFLTTYYTSNTPVENTEIDANSLGFQWAYSLPSDFKRLLKVTNSSAYSIQPPYVLSSMKPFKMSYIRSEENYALFPDHFTTYLIFFVAVYMCATITKDLKLLEGLQSSMLAVKSLASGWESSVSPSNSSLGNDVFAAMPTNIF